MFLWPSLQGAGWTAEIRQRGIQLSAARLAGVELLAEVTNQRFLVCMHCCQEIHLGSMLLLYRQPYLLTLRRTMEVHYGGWTTDLGLMKNSEPQDTKPALT